MVFNVEELLKKIPRPVFDELPQLYNELDEMARKVAEILSKSRFYDRDTGLVHFERMSEEDLLDLMRSSPSELVPLLVTFCGLSIRELEAHGVKDVYKLRETFDDVKAKRLVTIVKGLLNAPYSIETVIYKFYKNWEEHQIRQYRAKVEREIRQFFRSRGYDCKKLKKPIEVDGAIPPKNPKVVFQIRTGVMKDLRKRAKEFSKEYEAAKEKFPHAHFVPIYIPREHELKHKEDIRRIIMEEGGNKYELVVISKDELPKLLKKLEEWRVPKKS